MRCGREGNGREGTIPMCVGNRSSYHLSHPLEAPSVKPETSLRV